MKQYTQDEEFGCFRIVIIVIVTVIFCTLIAKSCNESFYDINECSQYDSNFID